MSGLGHQRKEKRVSTASTLPQIADITQRGRNVRLVPLADIITLPTGLHRLATLESVAYTNGDF